MANKERIREFLSTPPGPEYFEEKRKAGWRLVSVDWERGESTAAPEASEPRQTLAPAPELKEEPPYGTQVGDDCVYLTENAGEKNALIFMMEMIVEDKPISQVADELNRRGFRTRQGRPWSPGQVFDMLPRLIEVGPRIFTNEEYIARKHQRA